MCLAARIWKNFRPAGETDPPAPAGSNSLAIPESEVGLPECEIPPGQNYEREKGARMPAQPSGVARELIPPQGLWLIY